MTLVFAALGVIATIFFVGVLFAFSVEDGKWKSHADMLPVRTVNPRERRGELILMASTAVRHDSAAIAETRLAIAFSRSEAQQVSGGEYACKTLVG
jgi:hypothetical protein